MQIYPILFERFGCNLGTAATPMRVYEPGCVDLEKTRRVCASSDWDLLVDEPRYLLRDVELPDWLEPEEWIRRQVQFGFLWHATGVSKDTPETIQRFILGLTSAEKRLAAWKLLGSKLRSDFRKKLRDQVFAWLDTPVDERQFSSPLSPRQWEALLDPYTVREAKMRSNRIYWRAQGCELI